MFSLLKPGKPPLVAGIGLLIGNPDFFLVYFQFYFEGLWPEWVGQFEAFSEIMLRNIITGGVEVKNIVVQQHFPDPHESQCVLHFWIPQMIQIVFR